MMTKKETATVGLEDLGLDDIDFSGASTAKAWKDVDTKEQQDFLSWLESEDLNGTSAATSASTPQGKDQNESKDKVAAAVEVDAADNAEVFDNSKVLKLDGLQTGEEEEHNVDAGKKGDSTEDFGSTESTSLSLPQPKAQIPAHYDPFAIAQKNWAAMASIREEYQKNEIIPRGRRKEIWSTLLQVEEISSSSLNTDRTQVNVFNNLDVLNQEAEAACERVCSQLDQAGEKAAMFAAWKTHVTQYFSSHDLPSMSYYPQGLFLSFEPLMLVMGVSVSETNMKGWLNKIHSNLIMLQEDVHSLAERRRPLLKLLLYYHEPRLAVFLDQTFPNWMNATFSRRDEKPSKPGVTRGFLLPDAWIGALVDDPNVNLWTRVRLWDLVVLQEEISSSYIVFLLLALVINMKDELMVAQQEHLEDWASCMYERMIFHLQDEEMHRNLAHRSSLLFQTTPTSFRNKIKALSIHQEEAQSKVERMHAQDLFFTMVVSASDVIPSVFGQGPPDSRMNYFIVDCRPNEETISVGKLPKSYPCESTSITNPSSMDQLLETLHGLMIHSVHICIMGHGDDGGSEPIFTTKKNEKDESSEFYNHDVSQVNDLALFLVKQGFPYISVLSGGYAAVHECISQSSTMHLSDLADHDAMNCRLCHPFSTETTSVKKVDAFHPFSGALKDGKTWLQKKKSESTFRLSEKTKFVSTLREGKNWLKQKSAATKSEGLRFAEVKLGFASSHACKGEDSSPHAAISSPGKAFLDGQKGSDDAAANVDDMPVHRSSSKHVLLSAMGAEAASRFSLSLKTKMNKLRPQQQQQEALAEPKMMCEKIEAAIPLSSVSEGDTFTIGGDSDED